MIHEQHTRRHQRQQGFTLIEVLLVLALLAMMAALAGPALRQPFASRRLQGAADAVRKQWCLAREQAMRFGHTYAFRFAPGSDRFRVEPQDDDASSLNSATNNVPSGDTSGLPTQDPLPPAQEGTLPDGITFVADASPVNDPASQPYDPDNSNGQGNSGGGWSDAILFFPDGTTTDAHVVVNNQRGAGIRLALRGITGTVTVGEPTSTE